MGRCVSGVEARGEDGQHGAMQERIDEQLLEQQAQEGKAKGDSQIEEPGWQERIAQQFYLKTLVAGPQKAAAAFEKAGLPIGDRLNELVVRFEIDGSGAFTLILRDAVRLKIAGKTLNFATRNTGRIRPGKLEVGEGLKVTDREGRGGRVVEAKQTSRGVAVSTDDDSAREITLSTDVVDP